ncbi:MAG: RHS repeat-associated core domain-containing protein, partial [Bacteroidota bacterium]
PDPIAGQDVVQVIQGYYPFGMSHSGSFATTTSPENQYLYNGKEKQDELNLGWYDYGFRCYRSDIARFISVDPLSDMRSWVSPYNFVQNNPITRVDPTGALDAPIFNKETGELLGTDSEGWEGEAIVMDKNDFEQGMDHDKALDQGTELSKYGEGIRISDTDWQTVEDNGGTKMNPFVVNNSGSTVYYKPEGDQNGYSNSGAYPIEADKDLYAPVDGVATKKYSDQVFKVPTNGTVTVTSEGGFDLDFYGFGGIGRMAPGIGWIDKEYITNQDEDDKSWDALFNKAAKIGLKKY